MSWADRWIEELQAGRTVSFRPRGNSMTPRIRSGDLVTVEPCKIDELKVDDVVLCRVRGHAYLHLVTALQPRPKPMRWSAQISNNHGRVNGWTMNVYGKVVKVER